MFLAINELVNLDPRLVESRRKTGFLGFQLNLKGIFEAFNNYVENGPLEYLLTYKLSQVIPNLLIIYYR